MQKQQHKKNKNRSTGKQPIRFHWYRVLRILYPQSWELYNKAQQKYRTKVRKACKQSWRTFVTPLMTYQCQLGYTGLCLGNQKSS
jgi:hypothetical protein